MANAFELSGAHSTKQTRFAPLWTSSFVSGLYTQRNPLRGSQARLYEKFYPFYDAMLAGSNVEISNRLTPIRRPGNSVYNSATWTNVDYFYGWNKFSTTSESIEVIVDTATAFYDGTGPSTQTLLFTKSPGAGQTSFQSVGNVLYFGDGVDMGKIIGTLSSWTANTAFPIGTVIIDSNGNLEQLTNTIVPIATVATDSHVPQNVTITYSGGTDLTTVVSNGLTGVFVGLTTATWLNGKTGTITNVTSSSVTMSTTVTGHASYGPAPDTGYFLITQGGNPVTGPTQPVWNTMLLGTTNDNTAQWTNRGNPVENFGIAAPTTAPNIIVQGGAGVSWQPNTFYSNAQVIVDSNGNLQSVTTAGLSGTTVPTWATIDGHTTVDNTVTWTQLETAAELTWAANTAYTTAKPYILANASGTSCLFQAVTSTFPVFKLVGGAYVTSSFYMHNHSFANQCELRNPADGGNNPGSGSYPLITSATGNSVLFNPPQFNGTADPNVQPMEWATLNAAGNITGYTVPYSGATQNYNMIVTFTLTFPTAGQYTFTINHDDGMFWAIGLGGTGGTQQPSLISGPTNCAAPAATRTALNGYMFSGLNGVGANNPQSGYANDTYVVNIPTAGDYPVEIDYVQWENAQALVMYCQGQTPIPGTPTTGTVQPIWPAWTTAFAPAYPSVSETNNSAPSGGSGPGPLSWNNIGPAADYVWHASTNFFTTANSTIVDPNNNTEDPYRAGVTGTNIPTFATGINQLTNDNPNLIWINQGPAAAPPVGTLSTFNGGWTYYISLVNSITNTVSGESPASVSTGNHIGFNDVHVSGGLPAVVDPQVDYVAIWRTEDGGAAPADFLIPGKGNVIWTVPLAVYQASGYNDTTPDSGLDLELESPLPGTATPPGSLTGPFQNLRGQGINLAYHLNRIFFSIGNVVYWTAGPDITAGNGLEGVPATNNATFPSLVKHLVPTSIGLFVFTVSDIYLISGNGTASNPLFPLPYLPGKGISTYNAVAVNGTLMYIFSTASSVMAIDPNGGFYDLGFPIGDQFRLSNWHSANVYMAWHEYGEDVALFVADGATGWFRGNPTPSPESGQTWSPFASIVGGVLAVNSIETTPGVKNLLLGPITSGPILKRDLTTNADNGTSYLANFTIGNIVVAQPGQVGELAFITTDSPAIGTKPTVSVLLDEISGVFDEIQDPTNDPPQLDPSGTLYSLRFFLLRGNEPAKARSLQIQVSWPQENAANELYSLTLYGGYATER
jgi:hypothetical protein